MKVSPVSQNYQNINNIKKSGNSNRNDNYAQNCISEFPSQNILSKYTLGVLLPFGQKEKPKLINFDYFCLPRFARPDEYQLEAARKLDNGESVLVSAPTGTGKTAIAQYIMSKNLEDGKRTFYTTPLKALSNQKLLEFRKIYGEENVGIMTGDRKENTKAPIIVMTTEVYRNMAFDQHFNNINHIPDDVNTVIFDEFHYLGDQQRGNTWEESVIFSPPKIQFLGLSATIGNDEGIADWLKNVRKGAHVCLIHVPNEKRHVPLRFYEYSTRSRGLKPYAIQPNSSEILNYDIAKSKGELSKKEKIFAELLNTEQMSVRDALRQKEHPRRQSLKPTIIKIKSRSNINDYITLVQILDKQDKLPAIFFVFSKKNCNDYADAIKNANFMGDLTTDSDKEKIKSTIRRYKDKYKYIGSSFNYQALLKGYAVHHAGLMPVEKELVEELFNNRLVKVVFATETLAAGINMPARTVVISSPSKPTGTDGGTFTVRPLNANEYHQMAGRAGRRGIDAEGYVVNLSTDNEEGNFFEDLVETSSNPVMSRFTPSYSLIANYHRFNTTSDEVGEIFSKSFKIHSADDAKRSAKLNEMRRIYEAKALILEDEGYIERIGKDNIMLTEKGEVLQNINGYPQIPIVNLITSHALKGISPEELVLLAGSIVCGQYSGQQHNPEDVSERIDDIVSGKPAEKYIKRDIGKLKAETDCDISVPNCENIENAIKTYKNNCAKYQDRLERYGIKDDLPLDINLKLGAHIYSFAALNSDPQCSSISNWKSILPLVVADGGIKDEGTFYTAVNQTIELLTQMSDVCMDAQNIYTLRNAEDKKYYDTLAKRLKTAVLLLKQKPVRDNKIQL